MADILDELLNSGAVDTAALAAQLRNQKEHGMVGALSGSKRLAPYAANMEQQALEQAGNVGGIRRDQANAQATAAAALARWKAEMASKESEGKLNRDADAMLTREGFGSAERVANIRASNAKKDDAALNDGEIARQMETALDIAETSVANAGDAGGPVAGNLGTGIVGGGRGRFEGDMAGLSNAVRAQIRLHFKDASQSNIELQAFEKNLPTWNDYKDVREKKLENIRRIYAPESIRQRAAQANGGVGLSPTAVTTSDDELVGRYNQPTRP